MKAMLLAAGLGTRMRPLSESIPKPMLKAGGQPLLQYHVDRLSRAGIREIVINHARHGHIIESYFGDGSRFGVEITYSAEGDRPLDTGGGIKRALPLLGEQPFLVASADIYTDYDYSRLPGTLAGDDAYLVLVDNPEYHTGGDFCLEAGRVREQDGRRLTYANIGIFSRDFFENCAQEAFPLGPMLHAAAAAGRLGGEYYPGLWINVGTPEQLSRLDEILKPVRSF